MCYAIPAKLVEINGNRAVVDYFGEKRNIMLDLSDVEIGDYVYAQGGIMVRKIPEAEALVVLDTWKEIFFELKQTDAILSKVDQKTMPENVLGILQKVNRRQTLGKKELLALYGLAGENELTVLYELANNIRQREHGNASCVHGIIEFSNYCRCNCYYCGIRHARDIERYRMSVGEIVDTAKNAVDEYDFKALVLQSGEDDWYDDEKLIRIVREIRELGVLVFLSLGERPRKSYERLYEAGARAALMRFETSNEEIFARLRPGTGFQARIDLIKSLKEIGYVLATGFLVGLPGETAEDLVNNILFTKYLAPDMYSFGPLIPTKNTPLEDEPGLEVSHLLKTIAISRLADSNSNILVTTALETLDSTAARRGLLAGANSMMINLTPGKYRRLYSIYDNRAVDGEVKKNVETTVKLLFSLGRSPTDIGDIRGLSEKFNLGE